MTEPMDPLTAAWREVNIADQTLRPEFVDEPDGFYTHRVVLDEKPVARWVRDVTDIDVQPLAHHVEPLPRPMQRHRKRLVWRYAPSDASAADQSRTFRPDSST